MCVFVGDKYIVADCGGGTVDLTVHQIEQPQGTLKELYKASGEWTMNHSPPPPCAIKTDAFYICYANACQKLVL